MANVKTSAWPEFWNQRYKEAEHLYSDQPNELIRDYFENIKGKNKKVLVPGDGDGRNGLWLASRGFEVQGFDYSSVAVDKAQSIAKKMQIPYESKCCDVASWEAPLAYYDFVVLVFLHLEQGDWRLLQEKVIQSLAPNGTLIIQGFSKKQLGRDSGGPKSLDLLYDFSFFDGFNVFREVHMEEKEVELAEGPLHSGPAMVINFIGEGKREVK